MFKQLKDRIIMRYRIEALSDLHIGAHATTAPGEVDLPVIKSGGGTPIIPGSSLKGVLRTEAERILRGLGLPICQVPDVCGKESRHQIPCPVCMLFGSMNTAGSIRIRDGAAGSKRTAIRDGVAIDRKTRKAAPGAKYDLEVVPAHMEFRGVITIENSDIGTHQFAKLGGLLSVIDFFNRASGSIGGGTSRGFGQVMIEIEDISVIKPGDYLSGKTEGTVYNNRSEEYQRLKEGGIVAWREYLKEVQPDAGS